MPTALIMVLLAAVVVLVLLRVVLRSLPVIRWTRPVRPVEAVVTAVGLLGLVLHCGAMFFRPAVAALPGSAGYVTAVNAMGSASVIAYVVPAALVVFGLRRQVRAAVALLVAALLAVGITMYDGGPVTVHLTTIAVAVLVIAVIITGFATRTGSRSPQPRAGT